MARQSSARGLSPGTGLLARLFCFAPQANTQVGAFSRRASSKAARAESEGGEQQLGGRAAAAGKAAVANGSLPGSGSPPSTPSSAATFEAYLGIHSVPPPATPGRDTSGEVGVLQASSSSSPSLGLSNGNSGPISAAAVEHGYEADSDCPPLQASSPPRFRPAVRHPRKEVYGGAGAQVQAEGELEGGASQDLRGYGGEEGQGSGEVSRESSGHEVGAGVIGLIHSFERQSSASASASSSARREAGATEGAETAAGSASALSQTGSSSISLGASASRRRTDGATPHSQHSRGSSRPSLSGSISLFHFIGGGRFSRSGSSSRRLASALSEPDTPASAASSATKASSRLGLASLVVAAGPLPLASVAEGGQAPPQGAAVQRRLTDIQSGHHISLQKLRIQCGDFQQPPKDLLTLMARRMFTNRSELVLRLCDEGRLTDMQAAELQAFENSRLHTHAQDTGAVTSPPPAAPAQQAQQEEKQQAQQEEEEVQELPEVGEMPALPRIRTRVSQRSRLHRALARAAASQALKDGA